MQAQACRLCLQFHLIRDGHPAVPGLDTEELLICSNQLPSLPSTGQPGSARRYRRSMPPISCCLSSPDGHLYADLRGYIEGQAVAEPGGAGGLLA